MNPDHDKVSRLRTTDCCERGSIIGSRQGRSIIRVLMQAAATHCCVLSLLQCLLMISFTPSYGRERCEQWGRFEVTMKHRSPGNPFSDVTLQARFTANDSSCVVRGFYDGNDRFTIRFMPPRTGIWHFVTSSNVPELDKQRGSFECVCATGDNHGMVKVRNTHDFAYSDGKPYYPFGTTAYGWMHADRDRRDETLNALKSSGFNKVRMCIFPHRNMTPELFPFARREGRPDSSGPEREAWDFTRFNPLFFQRLEKLVQDLSHCGIEADLILFHPYDGGRWGFDSMPSDVNERYVSYVVARLASFRNIWWSLANEFDYVRSKDRLEWSDLLRSVATSDPYGHLCSIHGSTATYFDYWKAECSHASIQDDAPVCEPGNAALLRNAYHKPVVYDEVGYEGNLPSRWGRLSGEEMLYRIWTGVIAGTYVTHGECYQSETERDGYFIKDGGRFKGTSWKRIEFLRALVEECPGPLELADISRDHRTAAAGMGTYIVYFGRDINDSWLFDLPHKNGTHERPRPGTRFKVEIIDTWNMTISEYPEVFHVTPVIDYRMYDKDFKRVALPRKPYIALRVTEISP
jgi:hypothetical protein